MGDVDDNHEPKRQRFMVEMPDALYWALCERAARDHRDPKSEVLVAVERLLADVEQAV